MPSSNFNFKLEDFFILSFSSHPPPPITHPEKVVLSSTFCLNFNPNLNPNLKLNLNPNLN